MVTTRNMGQRLGLAGASTLVTLLVVDLAYRWMQPEDVVPRRVGQYDSILGWSLKPNARGTSRASGSLVHYQVNSKGLRDRETGYEKPAGVTRIVLLGDSRTFGYGVRVEQHFSTLLEGYFRNVEAINLGVSGYGVDQELLTFRNEGVKYQPDLVVAYVAHFGDQRHMYPTRFGRPKPQFVLENGALTLKNVPVPRTGAGQSLPRRLDILLTEHDPLYRDLSSAAAAVLGRMMTGSRLDAESPPPTPQDSAAFVDQLYELAEAILVQLNTEVTAAGAKFIVMTELPRLHADCVKKGLNSFNVSAPLNNVHFALPNNLAHVNEAGNGVLAWELSRYLIRERLLPEVHLADSVRAESKS